MISGTLGRRPGISRHADSRSETPRRAPRPAASPNSAGRLLPAVLLAGVLLSFLVAGTARADDPWWDASWAERSKLRFNNSDQAETLTDVPILVSLDSTRIDYTKTQDAGEDIRFVDAGGTVVLSYEIEKWDESGTSLVWVKVPQLDGSSTSDYVWMYYDNPGASDGQDAAGVWSNGYVGVWHLDDDPTSSAITFDNVTTNDSSSARASASFTHVTGAGSDGVIVVVVMTRGDQGASAVSYNGQPLTLAVSKDGGDSSQEWVSVWYRVAPPAGSHTVSVTFGSWADPTAVAAMTYFGVDQTNPIDATASKSSSFGSSTVSVDITTTTDNAMVVGGLGHHGGDTDPHNPGGDVTNERFDLATGWDVTDDSGHAGGEIATTSAGTYTFRWTNSTSDDYAIACAALRPTGGAITDSTLSPASPWWNASWTAREVLKFDNSAQGSNLTSFPVLVKLDSTRIDYAKTQSAGEDLRFVDADGSTVLDHEIEVWNESGTSWVWVKVPQIDAGSSTDHIWMYYGNGGASDAQNASGVWSSSYTGVWHLHDDFVSSTGSNNGTNSGSTDTTGVIGDGQSFDGSNDYIYTATSYAQPQTFTVSAWFKTSSASGRKIVGMEDDRTGTSSTHWDRHLYVGTDGKVYFGAFNNTSENYAISSSTYTDNAWHYAVGARDDTSNTLRLYVDGALVDSGSNSNAESYTGYWRIGSHMTHGWTNAADGTFPGLIDEVRVASATRSADWIAAQYLSMTDAFITFGGTSHDGTTAGSMTAGDLVPARIGDGFQLDGVDDHVVVPDSSDFDFGTGGFCVSMWFRKVGEARGDIFSWKNAAGDDDIGIILDADETMDLYFRVNGSGGAFRLIDSADVFTIDEWHLATFVRADSGGGVTIYVDGASVGTATNTDDMDDVDTGTTLWFGSNRIGSAPDQRFDGLLDEIRMSNVARSADWVTVQHLSMTDQLIRWGVSIISWSEVAP